MIYTMCAEDLNRDGEVDLFFFEDDDQIFFYRKGYLRDIINSHLFHPCMEEMSDDLVGLGSRLFLIKKCPHKEGNDLSTRTMRAQCTTR